MLFKQIYLKITPILTPFFLLTTVVFMVMCVWRGEIILGLQAELSKDKDQTIKVVLEQQQGANKISTEFEQRKADREQEKIYVNREIEKIVTVPLYSNECFDDAGVQQINSYATSLNSSSESSSGLSSNKDVE